MICWKAAKHVHICPLICCNVKVFTSQVSEFLSCNSYFVLWPHSEKWIQISIKIVVISVTLKCNFNDPSDTGTTALPNLRPLVATSRSGSNGSVNSNSSSEKTVSNGTITNSPSLEMDRSDSSKSRGKTVMYDKLLDREIKDLLVCLLYIIKNVSEGRSHDPPSSLNQYQHLPLLVTLYSFKFTFYSPYINSIIYEIVICS